MKNVKFKSKNIENNKKLLYNENNFQISIIDRTPYAMKVAREVWI